MRVRPIFQSFAPSPCPRGHLPSSDALMSESLLLFGCLVALAFGRHARRWLEGTRVEPWFFLLGAGFFVVLAWAPVTSGSAWAQVGLTLGALFPLYKAVQLFRERAHPGGATPA